MSRHRVGGDERVWLYVTARPRTLRRGR